MLKRSFIHIPGVGFKTENRIWEKGIFSWDNFLTECNKLELPVKKIEKVNNYLISSISHLKRKNINFFSNTLPGSEFWRLYHEFKDKVDPLIRHHQSKKVFGKVLNNTSRLSK